MITLLGVGHVFDIGRSIRSEILARRPKVVALELDPIRYDALLSRTPRARGLSPLARPASKGEAAPAVGPGHVAGLLQQLAGAAVQVVHLQQPRTPAAGPNASARVSVQP